MNQTTIAFWSWLFPFTYIIHIAEEYFGGEGYSAYLLKVSGVHFSPARFLIIQTLAVVLMIVGIVLARRLNFPVLMIVILGSTVLLNAVTHVVSAIREGVYGPGLITSVLIWAPLGIAALFNFRNSMNMGRYGTGLVIGLGINLVIAIITMRGGRFF